MVNTVNFSNHSGYGRSGGTKTTAAELNAMFESMECNELLMPTRLLTGIDKHFPFFLFVFFFTIARSFIYIGYIPGAESLSAVHKLADKLKSSKPNLIYLLDRTSNTRFSPTSLLIHLLFLFFHNFQL